MRPPPDTPPLYTVIYAADCDACGCIVTCWKDADREGVLEIVPAEPAPGRAPTPERVFERPPLVAVGLDGRVWSGQDAVRRVGHVLRETRIARCAAHCPADGPGGRGLGARRPRHRGPG